MNNIVFDIEVSQFDWLTVFKLGNEYKIIHNNRMELIEFLNLHKEDLFIGFNNYHYDNVILTAIIKDKDPFKVSKLIIEEKRQPWSIIGKTKLNLITTDLKAGNFENWSLSLKEAEANLGISIKESEIDFMLPRAWNKEELEEMTYYCKHDVNATEMLWEIMKTPTLAKLELLKTYDIPLINLEKTDAQITALILNAKKQKHFTDGNTYDKPKTLRLGRYSFLENYFSYELPKVISLKMNIANLECQFGIGGLHGAQKQLIEYDAILLDVVSYYPNLIINYNYLSRNVEDSSAYKNIVDQRVRVKHTDPLLSQALKLNIVSTYGAMKYEKNGLYDPKMQKQISISGQLFLVDLIEKLEDYAKLIQVNTDGIIIKVLRNPDKIIQAIEEWQTRTGLQLEGNRIKKIVQKDVNNYFLITDENKIKVKGSFVKQYKESNLHNKNSMRIVDLALIELLRNNTTNVEYFIKNHKNLIDFQIVAKVTQAYEGAVFKDNNNNIYTAQKVNRCFAVKHNVGTLFKRKNDKLYRVPNLPDNIIIYNDDIRNLKVSDIEDLDFDYYINMTKERYKLFLGINL